jgi:hypothetical protein
MQERVGILACGARGLWDAARRGVQRGEACRAAIECKTPCVRNQRPRSVTSASAPADAGALQHSARRDHRGPMRER